MKSATHTKPTLGQRLGSFFSSEKTPLQHLGQNVKVSAQASESKHNGEAIYKEQMAKKTEVAPPTQTPDPNPETIQTSPEIQALLGIVKDAYDLPKLREMLNNLDKPNEERTQFGGLSVEDSQALKDVLLMLLSTLWEKFFNDLDPKNPESVEKLRNWNFQTLEFPVALTNLKEANPRFTPKAMEMLESAAKELKTVEEVDALFDRHNGTQYSAFVDDARKKFTEPWVVALLIYAAQIAERDIQPCLVSPSPDEDESGVDKNFQLVIDGEKIINRRIISPEVRQSFLKQFEPVLEAHIDYFHKYSKNRKVAGYLGKALDIKYELYEVVTEEVIPEVEEIPAPIAEAKEQFQETVKNDVEVDNQSFETKVSEEEPTNGNGAGSSYDEERTNAFIEKASTAPVLSAEEKTKLILKRRDENK